MSRFLRPHARLGFERAGRRSLSELWHKDLAILPHCSTSTFETKEDVLTQLAIEGQLCLAKELAKDLPKAPDAAVLLMVERYWSFMLKNKQIYRLMNGMDGVPIDREEVGSIAQSSFEAAKAVIRAWLIEGNGEAYGTDVLMDELWAVLHGMAALYLDRSAAFDLKRAQDCVAKLLLGTRVQMQKLSRAYSNISLHQKPTPR